MDDTDKEIIMDIVIIISDYVGTLFNLLGT